MRKLRCHYGFINFKLLPIITGLETGIVRFGNSRILILPQFGQTHGLISATFGSKLLCPRIYTTYRSSYSVSEGKKRCVPISIIFIWVVPHIWDTIVLSFILISSLMFDLSVVKWKHLMEFFFLCIMGSMWCCNPISFTFIMYYKYKMDIL